MPAELQGDFSQSSSADAVAVFLSANPYLQPDATLAAQGIIDPTKIDPVAQKYIAAGLIPTSAVYPDVHQHIAERVPLHCPAQQPVAGHSAATAPGFVQHLQPCAVQESGQQRV